MVTAPSCFMRAERETDPLTLPIQQLELAWRARGVSGLDPVASAQAALLAEAPADARVLWRAARMRWLQGFLEVDPVAARNHWETGREHGLACLANDPDVAAALRQSGWRVTSSALVTTSPVQRPCLLWAAANGLALVERRGNGGLLDAEGACAMTDRAAEIVGPAELGLLDWELGVCSFWLTGDLAQARSAWVQALAYSGNPLYALALNSHGGLEGVELRTAPEYALETARFAEIRAGE